MFKDYQYTCAERFLRYVGYDTQSDEQSTSFPSTPGQLVLAEVLAEECRELGLEEVVCDEYGYVTAKLPATTDASVAALAFVAHMDTAPVVSGKDVKPIVHQNYQGQDIVLPGDETQVIHVADNPDLREMVGKTIITSDGTTLLGSDDKAGVAIILDAMQYLVDHPELPHGDLYVCFTPDEETGQGTKFFPYERVPARYGYTLDGAQKGELQCENFFADQAIVKFFGKTTHPGDAKGKMINANKLAGQFLTGLGDYPSPETTERKEGFVHVFRMQATEEEAELVVVIRDFEEAQMAQHAIFIEQCAQKACAFFPGASYELAIKPQYKNMKAILDQHPDCVARAAAAMKTEGIEPIYRPIRGGTDGALLSYAGLPTPNLFTGQHNIHSKTEWICQEDMEAAVRVLVEMVKIVE